MSAIFLLLTAWSDVIKSFPVNQYSVGHCCWLTSSIQSAANRIVCFFFAEMDLGDSMGLIPYNFEPEYSSEEVILLSASVELEDNFLAVEDWCACDNCVEMTSENESVCCRTSKLTVGNLESHECITEHTNFEQIVLNPVILEGAFIQIMAFKGQTGRAPDNLSNRYVCLSYLTYILNSLYLVNSF